MHHGQDPLDCKPDSWHETGTLHASYSSLDQPSDMNRSPVVSETGIKLAVFDSPTRIDQNKK
jgi:hypothetical protein